MKTFDIAVADTAETAPSGWQASADGMRPSGTVRGLLANLAAAVLAITAAAVLAGCAASNAQPQAAQQQVTMPLQTAQHDDAESAATIKALEEFEAGPQPRYTLGPGDMVTVLIWGHPELSGNKIIGPDGTIQLPYMGSIRIADMTAEQAGKRITAMLSDIYVGAVAAVTIDTYGGNTITVLGHVANPGAIHFTDNPRLLEVLARAGNPPGKADVPAGLTRCAIFRGNNRVLWIDLRPLLRGDDPELNIRLHRGDLVYVPESDQLVYVMGEVSKPGAYPLTPNMSFMQALAEAGGPIDSAQPAKIVLARPSQNLQQVIDLKNLVHGDNKTNYALEEGDIIYVPKSGVAKIGYVLQQLTPFSGTAMVGAAIF